MNYLILGQDGSIGGYERADILLCDLATNEAPQAIWRRTDELQTRFAPSSVDEVRADAAAYNTQIVSRWIDEIEATEASEAVQ